MAADISGVLHDRALVWLISHLRGQRYQAARGRAAPGDPVTEAGHEGRLLAMEHVGAITAEEAAHWRRRLHAAASWQEPARELVPDEVVARAVHHLEAILAPITASAREGAGAGFSAIAAYEKTGIIPADEALAWRERLRAKLDAEPERPPRCSKRNLLRVIAGPAERTHGLRITSVELYDDGVVLRWHHARDWAHGPETSRIWNHIDIGSGAAGYEPHALTDDLGTRYIGGGGPDLGISGAGSAVHFGSSGFTPAVPARARHLHVPLADGGTDIDL
jgi:hypothetical protein